MKTSLIAVIFFFSFSVHADPLASYRCQEKLRQLAKGWKASGEWEKQYQGGLESYFLASPTDTVGEWVMVRETSKGSVIAKAAQFGRIEVELSGTDCAQKETAYPHDAPAPGMKTDKDIADFVAKNKSGVIYVWSPRMTLSQRGISEIKKASKALKLPLLVLLDKQVQEDELKVLQRELGSDVTARVDSLEFRMRNIGQHYPTVLVFKNAKILPKVKYGFERSDRFEFELTDMLGTGK
jgi:hypothetical protein